MKTVLAEMLDNGGDPAEIAARRGLEALDEGSLADTVAEIVAAHPDEWARFAAGEDKLTGFFTGAVMKATSQCQRQGRGRRAAAPTAADNAPTRARFEPRFSRRGDA